MNAPFSDGFCTIITADYQHFARAIYDVLASHRHDTTFYVLTVDNPMPSSTDSGICWITYQTLQQALPDDCKKIEHYQPDAGSTFRWALKPVFLKYLLTHQKLDKVAYVDPDIYFYENPFFLFDELQTSDVLITPHWRSKDPKTDPVNFNSLFTGGLFNAGFFACNKRSSDILDWWLDLCAYRMEKENGFYVDQGYLNLFPIYYPDRVKIVQHRGCNVSNWNLVECKRKIINGKLLINGTDPVVFIHFTNATIHFILIGIDALLKPHLDQYQNALQQHKADFQFALTPDKPTVKKHKKSIKFFWNKFLSVI